MRLFAKQIVILIGEGVDFEEYSMLRESFEKEGAEIMITAPPGVLEVESIFQHQRGESIAVDIPIEAIQASAFHALVIPEGLLWLDGIKNSPEVMRLVQDFSQASRPIFASGRSMELLQPIESNSEFQTVQEGTPVLQFVERIINFLTEKPIQPRRFIA